MHDLRNKTIRAGFANLSGRAVIVLLRLVSIMTLGRLLTPSDYGLLAMVTSFIGMLGMLSGFGLFQASVQRDTMTEERASTLFWVNLTLGGILTLAALALAPAVGAFYHEPQLVLATSVVAIAFLFGGAGVQHSALLARQMRFGASALIDASAYLVAVAVAVGMAKAGWGYWALISMVVTVPVASTVGAWVATGWLPGPPRLGTGIRSIMHFGGTLTLIGLVAYVASNFEKFLLGRFWGTQALGTYSRAQSLIMFPTENLNSTVGDVAFAALSRARDDPERLRRFFLKGYTLVIALTVPLTTICALFADDLVAVALGPNWANSAEIFRLLAPTILVFAVSTPMGWLLNALGLVRRGLKMALVSAPIVMVAVTIGLPGGPRGVAIAYSAAMLLRSIPFIAWAVHGTPIRLSDVLGVLGPPLAASLAAGATAYAVHLFLGPMLPLFVRLFADVTLFGILYVGLLLLSANQRSLYVDMLRWWKVAPA